MKKLISIIIFMCSLFLLCTGCNSSTVDNKKEEKKELSQSAEAYIEDTSGTRTSAKVDLTGGWSVEFTSGAIYLYDSKTTTDQDSTAMCITLDEEVYNDHLKEAKQSSEYKELDNGYIYYEIPGEYDYLYKNGNAYFMITVYDKSNTTEVKDRISLNPEI